MIITLAGANFSASNIGKLSVWNVTVTLGDGATYSGPTYVEKGAILSATVSVESCYTIDSVSVLMGGESYSSAHSIDDNTVTISIEQVIGDVEIEIATSPGQLSAPVITIEEG